MFHRQDGPQAGMLLTCRVAMVARPPKSIVVEYTESSMDIPWAKATAGGHAAHMPGGGRSGHDLHMPSGGGGRNPKTTRSSSEGQNQSHTTAAARWKTENKWRW